MVHPQAFVPIIIQPHGTVSCSNVWLWLGCEHLHVLKVRAAILIRYLTKWLRTLPAQPGGILVHGVVSASRTVLSCTITVLSMAEDKGTRLSARQKVPDADTSSVYVFDQIRLRTLPAQPASLSRCRVQWLFCQLKIKCGSIARPSYTYLTLV